MPGENKSLGLVSLPERTFEHDVAIGDRFQNFSIELLRLSLAGIGAVGFLVVNTVLAEKTGGRVELLLTKTVFGAGIFVSLLFFGFAAAFALAHRYIGTESQSVHLEHLRLLETNADAEADEKKEDRDLFFRWSGRLLLYSGISLWLGALMLIFSFYPVLFKFRDF
jgi:hypothetical protein